MHPLAKYLRDAGLTQAQFAERAGLTQGFVSQLIAGRSRASGDSARAIQRATRGAVDAAAVLLWRGRAA